MWDESEADGDVQYKLTATDNVNSSADRHDNILCVWLSIDAPGITALHKLG